MPNAPACIDTALVQRSARYLPGPSPFQVPRPLAAVLRVGPDACMASRAWLATVERLHPQDAYQACPDGRWLLWLAARSGVDRKTIVLAACACAELGVLAAAEGALRRGDERDVNWRALWLAAVSIQITRAWCREEAAAEEVRAARREAQNDAYAADYAAYAAYAADYAAYAADYAADYADYAAAYAAYADAPARSQMLARCAEAVRREIPWPVLVCAMARKGHAS